MELPAGSILLADSAYTDYCLEEMLADNDIRLWAARKENSKQPHHPCIESLIQQGRKRIETSFSDIQKNFPKTIHAVTVNGLLYSFEKQVTQTQFTKDTLSVNYEIYLGKYLM